MEPRSNYDTVETRPPLGEKLERQGWRSSGDVGRVVPSLAPSPATPAASHVTVSLLIP